MVAGLRTYELFAIRYATRQSFRSKNLIGDDSHDAPMPLDYYVWVAKAPEKTFVIDMGFTAEVSAKRGRTYLRCPVESLALVGVDPAAVDDVIVTHLHYDHVGNFHKFPRAQFHVQQAEVAYATGPYMRHAKLAHGYEVDDVVGVVRLNFARRVRMHDGKVALAPGIELHPVGGHTAGLQFVRVHTQRGWVVVASDGAHFYENMTTGKPFATVFHVGQMLDGYEFLHEHAESRDHVVPGHDPKVMELYPPPSPDLAGIVARLDVDPASSAGPAV